MGNIQYYLLPLIHSVCEQIVYCLRYSMLNLRGKLIVLIIIYRMVTYTVQCNVLMHSWTTIAVNMFAYIINK